MVLWISLQEGSAKRSESTSQINTPARHMSGGARHMSGGYAGPPSQLVYLWNSNKKDYVVRLLAARMKGRSPVLPAFSRFDWRPSLLLLAV
eukprot:1102601-Pelagomonas_calceolata.AAC.1